MEVLVLAAFIVAKLRGYKLGPIFRDWPVYPLLVSQLLSATLYVILFAGVRNDSLFNVLSIASLASLVVSLVSFFIKYKQLKNFIVSVVLIVVGMVLQQIAINANGGHMPVYPSLSKLTIHMTPETLTTMYQANPIHIWGDSTAKLKFLTTWIDFGYDIHSPGDMLILIIPFIVLYSTIKQLNKSQVISAGNTAAG